MNISSVPLTSKVFNYLPGIRLLITYKKEWLWKDIVAGLSVAAIALPMGIACADLVGLPPIFGLYTSILPMVAYAIFSSSKLLIVGPDSATCMLIAVSIAPFAASGTDSYLSLTMLLTLMVGVFCILGGIFRLGFLVNFLSKPILSGFLNGLALSIILSQLGKMFGFKLDYTGFIRTIIDFSSKLNQTHFLTLIIGISNLVFLTLLKKVSLKIPAPLIAVLGSILAVYIFGYDRQGVQIISSIPRGFISIGLPTANLEDFGSLAACSLSIVLISFCNTMLADKSFAVKKQYEIDANQSFIALGAANIFSGLSHGFAVCGSVSRTAAADSVGGKTQLSSIFAALTIVLILLFFTQVLTFLPIACLGAMIISACIGLFNFEYMKRLYIIRKREFALAVFTSLLVITIGVLPAVLSAAGLAIIGILAQGSKPKDSILGKVENIESYQDISEYENAKTIPGIIIYRFNSSLVFVNADYFRSRVHQVISESKFNVHHFLMDASSISFSDSTSVDMLDDLKSEFDIKNISFSIARIKKPFKDLLVRSGLAEKIGENNFYFSVNTAVDEILKNKKLRK